MNNRKFGAAGEDIAAEILQRQGYRILKRNYRCRMGEIDIVASRGFEMSFVEVKTRTNLDYGRACESVNLKKQERIRKAAQCYLQAAERMGYVPRSISFDVVEVYVNHMAGAF